MTFRGTRCIERMANGGCFAMKKRCGSVVLVAFAIFAASLMAGCAAPSSRSQRETRDEVAKATEHAKPTIQAVAEKIGQAAHWMAEEALAAVEGVVQGWTGDHAAVNLNSASSRQLQTLPGVTPEDAKQIIDGRPYHSSDELVTRGVIPRSVYRGIRDRVEAR